MDILSVIIMICVWLFIGSAAKKARQQRGSAGTPGSARAAGKTAQRTAAPRPAPAKTVKTPAAPPVSREEELKKAKARLEKTKTAYTPVTVPAEGMGAEKKHEEHVVQPSFAPGAHAHEETSMTGFTECPPEKKPVKKESQPVAAPAAAPAPAGAFAFTREETLRAIIYSEILSKPKALR